MGDFRKKIGSALILLLLLCLFFSDILFSGRSLSTSTLLPGTATDGPYGFSGYRPEAPFSFDIGGNAWVNEPSPYLTERLSEYGFPLWNPHEGLGMPLIGDLNKEILNPFKAFVNSSPSQFILDAYYILRLFLLGLFTFLFLAEIGLSGIASLFGASFFMLCGYSAWWINLHPMSTVMYIPLIFYFYERWEKRRDRLSPTFLVLSVALSITGGKIPDVIMGLSLLFLYALFRGFFDSRLKGMFIGISRAGVASVIGLLLASVVVLPFLELHSLASPLAKAMRTGSSGHTLPLITSVSLWQPLFLGWKNYLYSSWFQWTPQTLMFYSGLLILGLFFYGSISMNHIKKTLPFTVFFLLLFSQIYGLLTSDFISTVPVFRSMNFLKYNSMLYFSLAVISACALDTVMKEKSKYGMFFIALPVTAVVVLVYYYFLFDVAAKELKPYLTIVLFSSLLGLIILGVLYYFFRGKRIFGVIAIVAMAFELFLYMPKDHPDRYFPYSEPPYVPIIKEEHPYRIIGDGESIPPLVSNAIGLSDIRGIDVLIPKEYYLFFENLISFSVPYTNNPDALIAATSPWSDLLGVKYVLTRGPLNMERLEDALNFHVRSLRWVRLLDAMIDHSIKGGATFGFHKTGGENRFSFSFPRKFSFRTKLRISEPFIVAGFTMKEAPAGTTAKVRVTIQDNITEVFITESEWKDKWLDVSQHMGKVVNVIIEGDGDSKGMIVLGDFGLSPGYGEERFLYERLLRFHREERDFLEYRGAHGGIHVYENKNVMNRAFVVHEAKILNNFSEVINELQEGINFREGCLLTDITSDMSDRLAGLVSRTEDKSYPLSSEKLVIKKYAPAEIALEVESKGGILVLSDLFYPGWKVKVNGEEEKVLRAFGLLRGVAINEGKSEILFYYRPLSFYIGIIVSLVTFIIWVLYLYIRVRYKGS